ncbi:mitochondrial outer membrane beta-barrel protein Tob55 [Verticillium alfalfae VaMs.102]|uniref:Mitochondrial outer membrane beta-barrel protein Tob55 n=1 Tax=Verticillium alfalfae (strain VaMs.102 / ATCC MYA-4576 / FGSC 10136) TaxID=526221 RepID=C9SWW4_VERA1|nr:mitochondrial outer membrane beta-barrel protein Tob55 [Verticillium alfalfae VaMs.102]EEY23505.1 mitochondrial outer membrane beta-barrel protein Tob55 [Verticillium alfalfae VaMs.102]
MAAKTTVGEGSPKLLEQQSTPMTVHNLTVHGAPNMRRAFLDPILSPIVAPSANTATTLGDVSYRLQTASAKLDRLGIFQPAPKIFLNSADQTNPSSTPTDVDIDILLAELPRYKFNAGTDVGNSEGSAFTSLLWRNIFGGAEQLSLNASTGTRTRSAYTAELSAPVASDPDRRIALEILSSATDKPWASHEEVLRGGSLRYQWLSPDRDMHSIEYTALWRQLTSLGPGASPTVRADAGDSLKSSLRHIFRRDTRDNPQLPQRGYHIRTTTELAGVGPLAGDVAFSKSELEFGGAKLGLAVTDWKHPDCLELQDTRDEGWRQLDLYHQTTHACQHDLIILQQGNSPSTWDHSTKSSQQPTITMLRHLSNVQKVKRRLVFSYKHPTTSP